jgi:hypothetical protein
MDIEKSAEVLTGIALDQAVVRVKHEHAYSEKSPIYGWRVFSETPKHPYSTARLNPNEQDETEHEAWANAADKVIEAEGYEVLQPSSSGLWYFLSGDEDCTDPGHTTRELALESAKRDYVQRNTRPAAPSAEPSVEEVCANCNLSEAGHFRGDGEGILFCLPGKDGKHRNKVWNPVPKATEEPVQSDEENDIIYGQWYVNQSGDCRAKVIETSAFPPAVRLEMEPRITTGSISISREGFSRYWRLAARAKSEEKGDVQVCQAVNDERLSCELRRDHHGPHTAYLAGEPVRWWPKLSTPAVPAQGDGELLAQQQWIDEALRAAGMNAASQNFEHRFYKLASFALAERFEAQKRISELVSALEYARSTVRSHGRLYA